MIARAVFGVTCVAGAAYLIANGYEHGWGWMIFLAFLSLVG